jgi:hypothetical protein
LYIDNIVLVTLSTSLKKNYKILERKASKLYILRAENYIEFDLVKTELIYFFSGKAGLEATNSVNLSNQQSI